MSESLLQLCDEIDAARARKRAARREPKAKAPTARETGRGGVQRAIVNGVRRAYPQALIAHVENETRAKVPQGKRGLRFQAARKADGLYAGFPDLIVTWPGRVVVFLEVKREVGGVVSDAQESAIARLNRQGHWTGVVRSFDEAVAVFRAAGVIR